MMPHTTHCKVVFLWTCFGVQWDLNLVLVDRFWFLNKTRRNARRYESKMTLLRSVVSKREGAWVRKICDNRKRDRQSHRKVWKSGRGEACSNWRLFNRTWFASTVIMWWDCPSFTGSDGPERELDRQDREDIVYINILLAAKSDYSLGTSEIHFLW